MDGDHPLNRRLFWTLVSSPRVKNVSRAAGILHLGLTIPPTFLGLGFSSPKQGPILVPLHIRCHNPHNFENRPVDCSMPTITVMVGVLVTILLILLTVTLLTLQIARIPGSHRDGAHCGERGRFLQPEEVNAELPQGSGTSRSESLTPRVAACPSAGPGQDLNHLNNSIIDNHPHHRWGVEDLHEMTVMGQLWGNESPLHHREIEGNV